MVAVAKLWRDVKWFHPALARGDVDWDAALVASLPKIQAARTAPELEAALAGLMAPLHDPSVHFATEALAGPVDAGASSPLLEWLDGDVALLHLHGAAPRRGQEDLAAEAAMRVMLARAKALVIDLRSASSYHDAPLPVDLNRLAASLIDKPLWLPAMRVRIHHGYARQQGVGSGSYYSAFEDARYHPARAVAECAAGAHRLHRQQYAADSARRAGAAARRPGIHRCPRHAVAELDKPLTRRTG